MLTVSVRELLVSVHVLRVTACSSFGPNLFATFFQIILDLARSVLDYFTSYLGRVGEMIYGAQCYC